MLDWGVSEHSRSSPQKIRFVQPRPRLSQRPRKSRHHRVCLRRKSNRRWLVTDRYSSFSSLVECRGQPLLDLSLYVSTENYHSITRPAYLPLLPRDYQWLVPSKHRTAAKSRTEHLNLSSLDIDSNGNDQETRPVGSNLVPGSLRSSHQTISSLLNQPRHASRFRLEALAKEFLSPLQELLGEKRYMISDEGLSSLDCLAFAYLALSLIPNVPQSWLADSMKTRYPALCTYVKNLIQELFNGPVNIDTFSDSQLQDSASPEQGTKVGNSLPWSSLRQNSLRKPAIVAFLDHTLKSVPFVGDLYSPTIVQKSDPKLQNPTGSWSLHAGSFPTTVVACTGLAASIFIVYSVLSDTPAPRRSLSDMGEIGAMLAMTNLGRMGSRDGDRGRKDNLVPFTEGTIALEESGGL